MTKIRIGAALAAIALSLGVGNAALAGPYSDDLSKCLVGSTSTEDRNLLVKWIFSVASVHPAVRSASALTDADRSDLSRRAAGLFESLLTERCKTQTQEAVRYEGPATLQNSFGVLGQAAMMELFSNEEVTKNLGELERFVDHKKIEEVLGKKPERP